jgi:3-hydroxybutyryl-CoA dehydrogenase
MHFFNPVPLMKLVEVVSGLQTDAAVAEPSSICQPAWGKVPVHARSTPGFIVNRIARPYYAETLALLLEQAATPQVLDACLRAAGFRMGPCELMDLIGHDTNFAVTQSVYEANFFDKRFVPSLVQREMVDGGLLGRKSGRGFFAYGDGAAAATAGGIAVHAVATAKSARCMARVRSPKALNRRARRKDRPGFLGGAVQRQRWGWRSTARSCADRRPHGPPAATGCRRGRVRPPLLVARRRTWRWPTVAASNAGVDLAPQARWLAALGFAAARGRRPGSGGGAHPGHADQRSRRCRAARRVHPRRCRCCDEAGRQLPRRPI